MFYFTLLSVVVLANAQLSTPPSITDTYKPALYSKVNANDLKITCTSTGNPAPTGNDPDSSVYWMFKKKNTNAWEEVTDTQTRKVLAAGTLHFIIVQDAHFGEYQCFAKNKLGKAMSSIFKFIESENKPFTTEPEATLVGKEGEDISIPCNGQTECVPAEACKIEWKIGDATDNAVITDKRIAIDSKGTLHFSFLKESDEKNSDQNYYACGSWNEDVKGFLKGPKMKLQVDATTSDTSYAPTLAYSNNVKALIGSKAEIQCIFNGKPLMTYIKWYKKLGGQGVEEEITDFTGKYTKDDFDRKLIINDVQESDEASYLCKANNGESTIDVTGTNSLDVQSPPIFLENRKPKALTLPAGSDATFYCETRSLPDETDPETPIWYQNGAKMSGTSTTKHLFSSDRTKLIVKDIEKPTENPFNAKDAGNFVCSVKNANGTVYGAGSLNIIDPITVQHDIPTTLEILPGDTKKFYVDADTDPLLQLKYVWSFYNENDNKTYNQNDMVAMPDLFEFSNNNQNLSVNAENLEGSQIYEVLGKYYVSIQNEFDEKVLECKMTTSSTIEPPTEEIVTTAGFDFWIIAVILGILVLFIVILLICCLCYRNRGGTYPVDKKEVAAGHDPEKELKDSGFHDLSRADDFDNPGYDNVSLSSMKPIESDEDSMGEYGGDLDISKFNEDGSFIGLYADKKAPTQSTV